MAIKQIQRCLIGQLPRLEVDHSVQQLKIGSIFAKIATEPGFATLMSMEAVSADKGRDLAGFGDMLDHPARTTPRLEIVQTDIRLTYTRGEIGQ